jgi:predicted Zn-dependent protease
MSDQVQLLVDAAVQAAESHDFLTASGKFAEALKLQPEAAALHEQHAQCLMELEQHEAALAAAQAAIHLKPEVRLVRASPAVTPVPSISLCLATIQAPGNAQRSSLSSTQPCHLH